jgi:uncharacterized protein
VVPEALPAVWWTAPVLLLSGGAECFPRGSGDVGYLVNRLRELSWHLPMAVAASVLLRGSSHLYQGFGGFIGNALMGAVFALFYVRFKRVVPVIVAHAIMDGVAFIGYAFLRNHLPFQGF